MSHLGLALSEFLEWEDRSLVELVADMKTDEQAYLVPLENVKSYLATKGRLRKIIAEVFRSQSSPIDPEMILRDHTAIFCILLRIGRATYIEHFIRYEELSDRRLPFDRDHPPTGFPMDDLNMLSEFCENQAMYCVPVLDSHMMHKYFSDQRILPITYKEPRGIQGVASTYVIKLYGPLNRLRPSEEQSSTDSEVNTFVLKTYSQANESSYREEFDGRRSVKNAEGIIGFYGSYIYGTEFNILLESADKGSLEAYFQKETPPSRGADIIGFWEGLFQLIRGLKAIHSVRDAHHDVKPENVLVLSNGAISPLECSFKFADFGRRQFFGRASQQVDAHEMQGFSAYSAPESFAPYLDVPPGKGRNNSTWAADIWSLGCIFSEAAVWIADGYKGLLDYRKRRMAEIDRMSFGGEDCFHNGEEVLQSVLDTHKEIEESLRRSDYITRDVLDSMVNEMLWEEDRPNAKALLRKAGVVLSRSRQILNAKSDEDFVRPSSSQSRSAPTSRARLKLPPHPPPLRPLPPLPHGQASTLSSLAEHAPANVENWRSQVLVSQFNRTQIGGSRSGSDLLSPASQDRHTISTNSLSDLERGNSGSIAGGQRGNDRSSSSTSFTSPDASVHDYGRYGLNDKIRVELPKPNSVETTWRLAEVPSEASSVGNSEWFEGLTGVTPMTGELLHTPAIPRSNSESVLNDTTRSGTYSEGNQSPLSFSVLEALAMPPHPGDNPIPPKSKKRPGFSLFPVKSRSALSTRSRAASSTASENDLHEKIDTRRAYHVNGTLQSFPNENESLNQAPAMAYLSVNTCLEWKKAHKKVKKGTQLPPLPGAPMLELLKGRNHAFIIDDSASMAPIWPEMKRVFEALTYILKDMSPDGTELFFTINYDTYRRKDTSSLCKLLDTNETVGNVRVPTGQTDIAYRLNLQLESYCRQLHAAKYTPLPPKGKKDKTRRDIGPTSFYILTNGEWGAGSDPNTAIKTAVEFLQRENYLSGQVSIQFINFASTPDARQKINNVAKHDFGLNIVSATSAKENVLEMLLGPLKTDYANGSSDNTSLLRTRRGASTSTRKSKTSVVSELE